MLEWASYGYVRISNWIHVIHLPIIVRVAFLSQENQMVKSTSTKTKHE